MKIYILDRKRSTTWYAELYFYGLDNVEVVNAEFEDFMRNHSVECVVSPANAYGLMDGGYDWAITRYFGEQLPQRVQRSLCDLSLHAIDTHVCLPKQCAKYCHSVL